jgi:glycerol-3-phosphate acyltransferase PlsY
MLLGYGLGSIPFGVLLTRAFASKDVRAHGSGNIGATNVARVAGKGVGALVLMLDALKGAVAVLLAMKLIPNTAWAHALVGYAAFVGHVFPVWLKGRGGKGVATALGVLSVLMPLAAVVGAGLWLLVVLLTRVSSVGSLVGGMSAVGVGFWGPYPMEYAILGVVMLVSMVWTHRANLKRMWAGVENRL